MMDLPLIWYMVIGVSVMMYAVLDGFDLGVGAIYLLFRKDQERRILLNAIGPVWDGNEVWLVIVLGGLMAGFTPVYAALLSGFYTPTMLLIFFIIFRAVAIEFRSKKEERYWRQFWDGVFCFSSIAMAFLLGVGVGNILLGVPLSSDQSFVGSLALFFRLKALSIGVCAVALFTMHGTNYVCMKTRDEIRNRAKAIGFASVLLFFLVYLITTLDVIEEAPWMLEPFYRYPFLSIVPVGAFCSICLIPYCLHKNCFGYAFIFSSLSILFLLSLFGIGTFPYLLRSSQNLEHSLTIYNTASSEKTLMILITIAVIGVPLVIAYGYCVYRIFRGKVALDKQSY